MLVTNSYCLAGQPSWTQFTNKHISPLLVAPKQCSQKPLQPPPPRGGIEGGLYKYIVASRAESRAFALKMFAASR